MNKKKRIISLVLSLALIAPLMAALKPLPVQASPASQEFSYTGEEETYIVPTTGVYEITAYGAGGGDDMTTGARGGYTCVTTVLTEGDTLYINVGGKGGNVGSGIGGYNGGGSSVYGAGGGGATSISYSSGLLSEQNTSDLIAVAGGGGGSYHSYFPAYYYAYSGISAGWRYSAEGHLNPTSGGGWKSQALHTGGNSSEFNYHEYKLSPDGATVNQDSNGATQESGYSRGIGQDATYGGAGGGGYYGGYTSNVECAGGTGGSGFTLDDVEFNQVCSTGYLLGVSTNGSASIKYKGAATRKITILTRGAGTYEGQVGTIEINANVGETVTLSDIQPFEGTSFHGWLDCTDSDSEPVPISNSFVIGKKNLVLKPDFSANLKVDVTVSDENTASISYEETDDISKYFKVYESQDGSEFYDIALSEFAASGSPVNYDMSYAGTSASHTTYSFDVPVTGDYYVYLKGTRGGNNTRSGFNATGYGGRGSDTWGNIHLEKGEKVYFNVAGQIHDVTNDNGYGYGGFASDMRVGVDDVYHRIMVAAAGSCGRIYTHADTGQSGCSSRLNGVNTGIVGGSNSGGMFYYGGSVGSAVAGGSQVASPSNSSSTTGFGVYNGGFEGWYSGGTVHVNCGEGAASAGSVFISGYPDCSVAKLPGGTSVLDPSTVQASHQFTNADWTLTSNTIGSARIQFLYDPKISGSVNSVETTFYDHAAPNAPSDGNVTTLVEDDGNAVEYVVWQDNGDNGSMYHHYVESYNADTDELIHRSSTIDNEMISGIKGYYYVSDNDSHTEVTDSMTFITEAKLAREPITGKYLHIAAVDNAGNISETYDIELGNTIAYTTKHFLANPDGSFEEVPDYVFDETILPPTVIEPELLNVTGYIMPDIVSINMKGQSEITEDLIEDIPNASIEDGKLIVNYLYGRNSNCSYTVNHYLQDLDLMGYTLEESETVGEQVYGDTVSPPVHVYHGFTSPSVQSGIVRIDNSLTFDYYYTRNSGVPYKVNHYLQNTDKNGFDLKETETGTGLHGESITPAVHDYYGFSAPQTITKVLNDGETTVFDYYYTRNDYSITVNHLTQNLDDSEYTLKDTETTTGAYNTTYTSVARDYPGFTNISKPNGVYGVDTVLNLYYKRNDCNVTIYDVGRYNDGVTPDVTLGAHSYVYPFEAEVDARMLGTDPSDNAYYNQFKYITATSGVVGVDGLILYRYFDFIYTRFEEDVDATDKVPGAHLEEVDVELRQSAEGSSTVIDSKIYNTNEIILYKKEDLPKYDKEGHEYEYSLDKRYFYSYSLKNILYKISNTGSVNKTAGDLTGENITVNNPVSGVTFGLQEMIYAGGGFTKGISKTVNSANNGEITFDSLSAGYYILKETASPSAYLKDDTIRWLFIDPVFNEDNTLKEYHIYIAESDADILAPDKRIELLSATAAGISKLEPYSIINTEAGHIEVYVQDKSNESPLNGEIIGLYDKDGTLIDKYTSNENGCIIIDPLNFGKYIVKEIESVKGYDPYKDELTAELTSTNNVAVLHMLKSKTPAPVKPKEESKSEVTPEPKKTETSNNPTPAEAPFRTPGSIKTIATVDGQKYINSTGNNAVVINDKVTFHNVGSPGRTYKLRGSIFNKTKNDMVKDQSGNIIYAEMSYNYKEDGTVNVNIPLSLNLVNIGDTLVIYEELISEDGNVAASHKDPNDADQTIYVKGYIQVQTGIFPEDKISIF